MFGVRLVDGNFTAFVMDDEGTEVPCIHSLENAYQRFTEQPKYVDAITLIKRCQLKACCSSCAMKPISPKLMDLIVQRLSKYTSVETAWAHIDSTTYIKNRSVGQFLEKVL